MLSLHAKAFMLELDGSGAPEAPLGGCNRRGLAAACVSKSRSRGSVGTLALLRSRARRYSAHKHGRMSRPSGECRIKKGVFPALYWDRCPFLCRQTSVNSAGLTMR